MIEWVVSSCILILVVIALRYLLRGRISLRLQYTLWLLVLARLLLPVSFGSTDISVMSVVEKAPAIQAVESVRGVDTIWQADNGSVEGYPVGPLMPDTPVTVAPSVTNDQFGRMESALTLRKILLPVWWIGAAVTLLVFLTANLRFAERLRKSRRPLAVEGAALSVYVAEERAVPCLFGLFRPAGKEAPHGGNCRHRGGAGRGTVHRLHLHGSEEGQNSGRAGYHCRLYGGADSRGRGRV